MLSNVRVQVMNAYIYPRLLSPLEADILLNQIHRLGVYRVL